MTSATARVPVRRHMAGIRRGQAASGYLFTAPAVIVLVVFLVIPIFMALWVSFSDWGGRGSPFASGVHFVGLKNYGALTGGGGLAEQDFGTALRNNLWFVILVVPTQTVIALLLAVLVNNRILKGRGFFRTAFYFPSVTSSVAITVLWYFLFNPTGAVNQLLGAVGLHGPNWPADASGVLHDLLSLVGLRTGPGFLVNGSFLGVTWWDWLSGPSVGMMIIITMVVFTTSGTFMLLFIAALQNLSQEVEEAAMVDGATAWQRFRLVTLPQLRTTLFTVLTLGLIGTWQVFDQVFVGSQGDPGKTTLTPAYLSYVAGFQNQDWGQAAAIAFILFAIIVFFTLVQRWVLRERGVSRRRMRRNGFDRNDSGEYAAADRLLTAAAVAGAVQNRDSSGGSL
ncbi:carbohydrate ABC transporter permease [Amnibacterium sp.]|uniref:carbohydrate ABC transporter permease n=1 Tax=Amnibacterium sp. TaxID=1872496 RepID=UPI0026213D14|nr:sugar ABC transporter permease [Amnibacterium sp.]MCU1473093.1 ABC-type sugar transport system, permease component [Amnibacterium sp.]